jgi:hypothetical protein
VPEAVFLSPDGKTVWVLVSFNLSSGTTYDVVAFQL